MIRNTFPLGRDVIRSLFDVLNIFYWNLVEVDHFADDMRVPLLFLEKESATGNPMFKWNRIDGNRTILHDQRMFLRIDRIELDMERQSLAKQLQHGIQIGT